MIIILLFNELGKMLYEVIAFLELRFIGIIYLGMHQKFVCLLPENAIFVHSFRHGIFRQKRPLL